MVWGVGTTIWTSRAGQIIREARRRAGSSRVAMDTADGENVPPPPVAAVLTKLEGGKAFFDDGSELSIGVVVVCRDAMRSRAAAGRVRRQNIYGPAAAPPLENLGDKKKDKRRENAAWRQVNARVLAELAISGKIPPHVHDGGHTLFSMSDASGEYQIEMPDGTRYAVNIRQTNVLSLGEADESDARARALVAIDLAIKNGFVRKGFYEFDPGQFLMPSDDRPEASGRLLYGGARDTHSRVRFSGEKLRPALSSQVRRERGRPDARGGARARGRAHREARGPGLQRRRPRRGLLRTPASSPEPEIDHG